MGFIKRILVASVFFSIFSSILSASDRIITIGLTPNPFAIIVESMREDFEKEGYELKIVEFSDYILPNKALSAKELDANLYQHKPFLDEYNKNTKSDLVATTPTVIAPMAVFSKKLKNLNELKDGSKIAIPNDPTNESRALELLEKAGLIKLNDKKLKTPIDIVENPKKLKFLELKAAQLPRALGDADVAVIPTNYALGAKLNPQKGLFIEDKSSLYAIVVAVEAKNKESEKTRIIKEVLKSEAVKNFVEKKYNGAVISLF
ncbi:MetQ/NlpA family ABC transporter substrate-binding protein [Campylobacter sp.]|uniref:MetQ/NlpA family ABC transporter substrate-binding protein n=1 Tax=Campylobacter sp. TaxID=205 RepID=UPI0026DCAC15|nr:MetQ/NlpA family ABC transporter substrate-binding protein [Campylobacter sp.]MDO4674509.1 MetQ/NlpA family ABC transporter substrate-binding protein [Campylobacter sp.]